MTCYCIYLSDEKNGFIENAGVFPTESLAYVVAQNLAELITKGFLFYTYNDFQEPFTKVEIVEYSENNEDGYETITVFNPLEEMAK